MVVVTSRNKQIIILSVDESTTQLMTSHHDTPLPDKVCQVDVDFQSSISHMGIQWTMPANVTTLVTYVKWGIQEQTSRSVHTNYNLALYKKLTVGFNSFSQLI